MTGDYRDYLIGFLYGKLKTYLKSHSTGNFYGNGKDLTDDQEKENIVFYEVENAMTPYWQKLNPQPEMKERRRNHD